MNLRSYGTVLMVACAAFIASGCSSAPAAKTTGFLSDYSNLQRAGEDSMRFVAAGNPLGRYDRFIVDPVQIFLHSEAAGHEIPRANREEMTIYFRGALVNALAPRFDIVSQPGPGVARIRVGITDIKKSTVALNVLPTTRLAGAGLGGASVEAEIVDSVTGKQLAAIVEGRLANRINLPAGWSDLGDAKAVMDDWAQRLRERLDEAHQ
jgi:hypothetical protein